jgi:hypothetical protein
VRVVGLVGRVGVEPLRCGRVHEEATGERRYEEQLQASVVVEHRKRGRNKYSYVRA